MNNLADKPELTEQDLENESPETQDVADDSFEIEVSDDTPEEEKPRLAEDREPEVPSDDEIDKYSVGVQKRINKLKFEAQEQERQKLEAHRLQEEALRYAQQVKSENEQLRKNLDAGEETLIGQAKGRIEAQLDKAKSAYKAAYESGDPDALIEAQEQLTTLKVEADRINNYKPQVRTAPQQSQPQYAQPAPQANKPDVKALEWGKKNTWFENPETPEMTGFAYGVHQKLVQSGIDPRSDSYYDEIDKAMKKAFPDKFDDGQIEEEAPQRQSSSVVAAPSRTTKKPRTVRLTSTQASLAKRLGLSNEQYVAQMLKDQSK
jgi:hypothetical protein